MNSSYTRWTLIGSAIISFGIAVPALAQSDSSAVSASMRSAGQSIKSAGSDTLVAVNDT